MPASAELRGCRILIVEDDYLVAQAVALLIEEAGAKAVGPIGSVPEAIEFLNERAEPLDCALLDVSLRQEKSYPVADALSARQIGVVFATGYGSDALDSAYQHYPRCEKPFTTKALLAAVRQAIG